MTKYYCKCGNIIDDGNKRLFVNPELDRPCPDCKWYNFWKHSHNPVIEACFTPSVFPKDEVLPLVIIGKWKK